MLRRTLAEDDGDILGGLVLEGVAVADLDVGGAAVNLEADGGGEESGARKEGGEMHGELERGD